MEERNPKLADEYRGIRKIEVIEVVCCRGKGTKEDICRYVHRYYSEDNGELKLIAEVDEVNQDLR